MILASTKISTSVPMVGFLFSGIGGTVICSIITLILGGFIGYRVGIKSRLRQNQKAGNGAYQKQSAYSVADVSSDKSKHIKSKIQQKQRAGENANQSQVGGHANGK